MDLVAPGIRSPVHLGGRITCSGSLTAGMRLMAKQLFGTDGIRGVPGKYPLDDATLERAGHALGKYLRSSGSVPASAAGNGGRVLIGRDTRESGLHIAEIIARGLAAAGVDPVSSGVLTTPG
ncbi:MAG: hypothetical protein ACRD52_03080, partial [Candidatus Acidiferrales bacterium]